VDIATFAGGCFWCMEPPFENLEGVMSVTAGYTGGEIPDPTYEQVCTGTTGHYEAVEVRYDPSKVTYDKILEVFWRNIDPTDPGGQFADRGTQYRTAIFYYTAVQKQEAEQSKARLGQSGKFTKPIATSILPATGFYRAEEYHQGYARKNAFRYKMYRKGSGRENYIKLKWPDSPEH
jgi:methionine-S-sulfoxide reductase